MKQLLNTLFITTQGTYLARKGDTVLVRLENETKLRIPIHTLSGIVCFGQVSYSPFLMGLCAENGVRISFLTEFGKFLARVEGPVSGNVLLRKEQYRRSDQPGYCAQIARSIVLAKLANCRVVLLRAIRETSDSDTSLRIQSQTDAIYHSMQQLDKTAELETIRGIEGEAAVSYFSCFDDLITAQKEDFKFTTRTRRPPLDKVNALLSFLYSILTHDVSSALETVGLDPAVGFLHADRPGRPSLALDIMEEFRAYFVDRLVLSMINRRQIKPTGLRKTESGAVEMDDNTRKIVLAAWQKRKQDQIMHPFLQEKVKIGMLPYVQALLMARYFRGDLDSYPPFLWR